MKILHIGPSTLPVLTGLGGAVQRRIWELARVQAGHGHDVTVLSPSDVDRCEVREGVTLRWLRLRLRRPARDVEFLLRSRLAMRSVAPFDVLHAHGSPNAVRFLRPLATCCVQTVDFFRYRATSHPVGHRYYTDTLNRYDALMGVSLFCSESIAAAYPQLRTPPVTVPNGVDLVQFQPDPDAAAEARAALALPPGRLVVYLGRVCHQKGSDLLGGLARGLDRRGVDATVVAVGPPEQFGVEGRSPLMDDLAEAGVVCTGAVPDQHLRGILNAASVMVLPTREDEMFGMAALEALACGTPVVASDLGGIPEAVGPAGRLFPTGDEDALVDGVVQLLLDDDELRLAAVQHASRFSWPDVERATAGVYADALASVRPSRRV